MWSVWMDWHGRFRRVTGRSSHIGRLAPARRSAKSQAPSQVCRLASRPALRAATALTRLNRSAQRLSCGRYVVPSAKTLGPSGVVAKHCVERGEHLTHHRHDRDLRHLAPAARHWWDVLSAGFQLLALMAAM
jgi:hypothetical protein